MNIKLKAAIDTAVVVGTCIVGATGFALLLNYVPMVALLLAVGALTYIVYKFNLGDLEMKEKLLLMEQEQRDVPPSVPPQATRGLNLIYKKEEVK